MCGITGLYACGMNSSGWEPLLRSLLANSQIRGLHARGVAWLTSAGELRHFNEPGGLGGLALPEGLAYAGSTGITARAAFHARYSTSDLAFNQPLAAEGLAVTHNGVISQEDPALWEALYGLRCEGGNDTELLLRSLLRDPARSPLEEWPEASIAAAWLDSRDGSLTLARNGKRPLYVVTDLTSGGGAAARGVAWASTHDILRRSGFPPEVIRPLPAGERWVWANPAAEPQVLREGRPVPDLTLMPLSGERPRFPEPLISPSPL